MNWEPPETSGGKDDTTAPCMNFFVNVVGHPANGSILCLPVEMLNNPEELLDAVIDSVGKALDYGHLWVPHHVVVYIKKKEGRWVFENIAVHRRV